MRCSLARHRRPPGAPLPFGLPPGSPVPLPFEAAEWWLRKALAVVGGDGAPTIHDVNRFRHALAHLTHAEPELEIEVGDDGFVTLPVGDLRRGTCSDDALILAAAMLRRLRLSKVTER